MPESAEVDFVDTLRKAWNILIEWPAGYIVGFFLATVSTILVVTSGAAVLGMTGAALDGARGKEVTIGTCFSGYQRFFTGLLLAVLYAIIVGVGFALLVIPGLVAAVLLTWSFLYMQDDDCGAVDAIKRSYELATDNVLSTVVTLVIAFILNVIGQATVIGWLLTTPLAMIFLAIVYDELRAGAARDVTPPAAA